MKDAVGVFFAMTTQWRWITGMAGAFRTGLDYAALPTVAAAIETKLTPDVMDQLRTLEVTAMEAFNRK